MGGGEQLWRLNLIHLVKFSGPDFFFFLSLVSAKHRRHSGFERRSHTERMKRARRDTNPRVVHLQPFCLDACRVSACVSARFRVCVLRFEGPAGGVGSSVGGSVGRGRLDRLVGHDPGGKLLLGLFEAGACGAVESVYLEPTERDRGWWA